MNGLREPRNSRYAEIVFRKKQLLLTHCLYLHSCKIHQRHALLQTAEGIQTQQGKKKCHMKCVRTSEEHFRDREVKHVAKHRRTLRDKGSGSVNEKRG